MATKHEIRRGYPGSHISRIVDSAAKRGVAFGAHDSDPLKAKLATGDTFLGFATREITADGPVLADHVYPGRLELPFKAGQQVSLQKADEVEVEGDDYIVTSGTGAITSSTAEGTALSFKDGKFYVAQGADQVWYRLSANLSGTTAVEDAGAVRIVAEAVR